MPCALQEQLKDDVVLECMYQHVMEVDRRSALMNPSMCTMPVVMPHATQDGELTSRIIVIAPWFSAKLRRLVRL